MTRKLTEWPFENGQTEKVGLSDGCRGNAVPLVAESKHDFRELGAYLGSVGCNASDQHQARSGPPFVLPFQRTGKSIWEIPHEMLGQGFRHNGHHDAIAERNSEPQL